MLDVLGGLWTHLNIFGGVRTHLSIFRGGQDFAAFGYEIEVPPPLQMYLTPSLSQNFPYVVFIENNTYSFKISAVCRVR